MNNYIKRRHKMSLTEKQSRARTVYVRQFDDGVIEGYTTQYINGKYVGIRGGSSGLFYVQVGFSAQGAKESGWVSRAEANRFIYENTKG